MPIARRQPPVRQALTLRWFSNENAGHAMTENGRAACDPEIRAVFTVTLSSYWKSDMPPGIAPCRACEAIMAGDVP